MFGIRQFIKKNWLQLGSSCLVAMGSLIPYCPKPAIAQTLASCQLPAAGQVALFVNTSNFSERNLVRSYFPPNIQNSNITDCLSPQGRGFTKIVGFSDRSQAQRWETFFSQNLRTQTVLLEGSGTITPTPRVVVAGEFKPTRLSWQGYSVLVDYQNDTSLVQNLRAYTNQNVALTSFVGRPYLLVQQTTNQSTAIATAENLSNNGYWVFVVKSADVTLLSDQL